MAADEATALSNIHLLLDTLESQQHSMVVSLKAKEVSSARDVDSVEILGHNALAASSICKEPGAPLFPGSRDLLACTSGLRLAADAEEAVAITGSSREAGLERMRQRLELTIPPSQLASALQEHS